MINDSQFFVPKLELVLQKVVSSKTKILKNKKKMEEKKVLTNPLEDENHDDVREE